MQLKTVTSEGMLGTRKPTISSHAREVCEDSGASLEENPNGAFKFYLLDRDPIHACANGEGHQEGATSPTTNSQ